MNPSHVHSRRAGVLAGLSSFFCLLVAGTLLTFVRPERLETTEDVITGALVALSCLGLVRLAWACGRAAVEFFEAARVTGGSFVADDIVAGSRFAPGGLQNRGSAPKQPHGRLAACFLAIAALTMVSAQAAQASPRATAAVAQTTGAASPWAADSTMAPLDSSSPDHAAPAPGFDGTDQSTPLPASAPPLAADVGEQDRRTPAPQPGWTPSAQSVTPRAAPLALGVVRDGDQIHEHVVVRGDTLWGIVASHLGSGAEPEQVAEALDSWLDANPDLRGNPDLIMPGQILVIPRILPAGPGFTSTTSPHSDLTTGASR